MTDTRSPSLGRNEAERPIVKGFGWSAISYGAQGLGQVVMLTVLARRLSPSDFGVVSVTVLVLGFGRLFTQSIVGPAIIQRKDLTSGYVTAAAVISMLSGVIMGLITLAASSHISNFFHFPGLTVVLRALSVVFVFQALSIIPEALLQRAFKFRVLSIAEAIAFVVGYTATGVMLAVLGAGVWSLVGAVIVHAILYSAIVLVVAPHRAWTKFSVRDVASVLHYGGGMTLAKVFNYSANQGDYLVVGRVMGPVDLGFYGRAYQLAAMPAMFIGQVLDRVLFPLMASKQDDREQLAAIFRRGTALITTVMLPLSCLMVVLAPEIIAVLLGSRWTPVVVPFQILAAGLAFRCAYKISDSLARSAGVVYARAWRQLVYAALVLVAAMAGSPWGLSGVATGVMLAILGNYVLMSTLSIRTTGLRWSAFVGAHTRGLALASAVLPAAMIVRHALGMLGAGSVTVLLVTPLAVGGAVLMPAFAAPSLVLGDDGAWLMRRLRRSPGDAIPIDDNRDGIPGERIEGDP